MPYDRDLGLIYVDETTTPHRGVEIADVQRAVPVTLKRTVNGVTEAKSSSDLGVLINKIAGNVVEDNAGGARWTVSSRIDINPMAKYKPVRKSKLTPLTYDDFASVRFGVRPGAGDTSAVQSFMSNAINPQVTWIYDKPRGSQVTPNEPYRITDFENYLHKATPPFGFTVSGELGGDTASGEASGSVGVTVSVDALAYEVYYSGENTHGWQSEYNLSVLDLFSGIQTPGSTAKICVCVHRLDNGVWKHVGVVVSKMTLGDNPGSSVNPWTSYAVRTINMFAHRTVISGRIYPEIKFLDGSHSGKTYRFIVGLCGSNNGPDINSSTEYNVYEEADGYAHFDVYSLALREGIDRKDIVLYKYGTIQRLSCRFVNSPTVPTLNYLYTDRNNRYDYYSVEGSLYGLFTTPPQGAWAAYSINVKLTFATQGTTNPVQIVSRAIDIQAYATTSLENIVQLGQSATSLILTIEHAADTRTLEFTGVASYALESVPFENNLTVSAPKPTQIIYR